VSRCIARRSPEARQKLARIAGLVEGVVETATDEALRRLVVAANYQRLEEGLIAQGELAGAVELRRENQRLRQERDLLKRAAAFFATENGTR